MTNEFQEPVSSNPPSRRYELLYQVSDAMTSTLEPQAVLKLILSQAVDILSATSGSLILMDKEEPDILSIEVAHNLDPDKVESTRLRLGEGVTGIVAQSGKPLVVPDVESDPRYVEIDSSIRSEIAVPLKLADQVIGVINLDSTRPNAFSEKDLEILVPLANHAAKVIQNAQLYDSVRQKADTLHLLQSITRSITSSLDLKEVLRRIVEGAVHLLGGKLGSIWLLDESKDRLHLSMSYGEIERYPSQPVLPVHQSLLGRAIVERHPLTIEDVQNSSLFRQKEMAVTGGFHALIAVPMLMQEEVIGLLAVYYPQIRRPSESEVGLLSALADQSVTAIQNARLHDRVFQMEEKIYQFDKLSAVGETAAGLAHEIRNPLAVINMLVSSLEEDFQKEDPRHEDLRVIRNNIIHIHGLVEGVLNLTRVRSFVPEPTDLRQLVRNALRLLEPKTSRQQIRVRCLFEDDLPLAQVDPGRIHQVLLNLLQNSMEAIGTRGEIILSLAREIKQDMKNKETSPGSEEIVMTVHDTGPGISSEAYPHLFVPFHTTKEQGIGLGLSIVRRIIEEHGGTISVKTSASEGTCITLILPVA